MVQIASWEQAPSQSPGDLSLGLLSLPYRPWD